MSKFNSKLISPILLVVLLILTGCGGKTVPTGPAPKIPVPSLPSSEDCLIGTWQLSDFADSINSMLPADINFQYQGTSGRIRWTFDVSGVADVQVDNFSLTFADKKDPTLVVTVTTNGEALRDYKITGPGEITFADANDSQLTYTATIDGVTVNMDALLKTLFPIAPATGSIAYRCNGNSLDVIPPNPNALPEGFVKVQ
jgi:hypothetical protein